MKKINKIIFSILMIVIIAISLIVVLFIFNNEPSLIGSWSAESGSVIITFRENNTMEIMYTEGYLFSGIYAVNGNIINVTLTIPIPGEIEENTSWEMKYEFLSYNRIKLTNLSGETDDSIIYQRV
jgi:hypothetical protein